MQRRAARLDDIRHAPCSDARKNPASGNVAAIPGGPVRIQAAHLAFIAVDAALCRHAIGLDFALSGTMGSAMFHSEATGMAATSPRSRDHGGRSLTLAVFRHARLLQVIGKMSLQGKLPLKFP
jgi:hypothetical protein